MIVPYDVMVMILYKHVCLLANDDIYNLDLSHIISVLCEIRRSSNHYLMLCDMLYPYKEKIELCKKIKEWISYDDVNVTKIRISNTWLWLKLIDNRDECGGILIKETQHNIVFTLYSSWKDMPCDVMNALGINDHKEYRNETWNDVLRFFRKHLTFLTVKELRKPPIVNCGISWYNPNARESHIGFIQEDILKEDIRVVLDQARQDLQSYIKYLSL